MKATVATSVIAPMASSLIQLAASSLIKAMFGKRITRARRGYNNMDYEPRFNGVFSRDNLPKIKDEACVINLDDKESKATHWVSLFIVRDTAVYFDSFGI